MHPLVRDLTGQQFGRLTVIEQAASRPKSQARWLCQCQCGGEVVTDSWNLRNGFTTSCGCLQVERTRDSAATHATWGLPEFNAWRGILRRCNNPKAVSYDSHGGRGIQCLFESFSDFVADVGERPSPQHRLFRLDREQHFEPGNCRWLLPAEHYKLCPDAYTDTLRRRRR